MHLLAWPPQQKKKKTIANTKPWSNQEVRELLITEAPYRAKDAAPYGLARSNLNQGIKAAKKNHFLKIDHWTHWPLEVSDKEYNNRDNETKPSCNQ